MYSFTLKFDHEKAAEILATLRSSGLDTIADCIEENTDSKKLSGATMLQNGCTVTWKLETV